MDNTNTSELIQKKVLEIYDELDNLSLEGLDEKILEFKEGLQEIANALEETLKLKEDYKEENTKTPSPFTEMKIETKTDLVVHESKLKTWEKVGIVVSAFALVGLLALVIVGVVMGLK